MRQNLAVLIGEGALANGSPRLVEDVIELDMPERTSEIKVGNERYLQVSPHSLPTRGYEINLFDEYSILNSGMQIHDLLSSIESVFTFDGNLFVPENSYRDSRELRGLSEKVRTRVQEVPRLALGSPIIPKRGTIGR